MCDDASQRGAGSEEYPTRNIQFRRGMTVHLVMSRSPRNRLAVALARLRRLISQRGCSFDTPRYSREALGGRYPRLLPSPGYHVHKDVTRVIRETDSDVGRSYSAAYNEGQPPAKLMGHSNASERVLYTLALAEQHAVNILVCHPSGPARDTVAQLKLHLGPGGDVWCGDLSGRSGRPDGTGEPSSSPKQVEWIG